jgi:eukaryotic-like serine/threonine-protein kinase
MRVCPTCRTEYPDGETVCPRDGAALMPVGVDQARTVPDVAGALTGADTIESPAAALRAPAAAPAPLVSAPSSEVFDSLVGATLANRYQIIRRIGEGGMGAVYEARHTIIGKRVAVKVLLEKFLTKSDFVARLLQEARLASAIGHEHIVDVTDFGTTDDGRAFVAMEFLEGESLAQLVMREAPLPVERSLRITRQVASALGAAHAKGIVHRDVKPENVYLIRRGDADFVKVVDFGISKAVKQGQGDDTPDYRLTHTGLLLGTPLYMSPEQARGDEDLDERVDVWAMGVMLYECLTGEVPFRANNYLGIISQVLTHTAVPPSKLRPELGIPEAVEAVVMHAMEKDRTRRYARMSDVERDLDRLLAGDQNIGPGAGAPEPTAPAPVGPSRSRAWVWGAAIAALVGGVVMVLARPEAAPESAKPAVPAARVSGAAGITTRPSFPPRTPRPPTPPPADTAPSPGKVPAGPAGRRGEPGEGRDVPKTADGTAPRRSAAALRIAREKAAGTAARPLRDESPPAVTPARAGNRSADPVLRGAVPSGSAEGYPKN